MAHMVETMAWRHQVPWHGLGEQIFQDESIADWQKRAGLDWTVEKLPLVAGGDVPVASHCALVRSSDRKVLDIVGKDWNPVQNHDVFEFFRQFTEAGHATMETAGSLRGGRQVWALANLGTGFEVAPGDFVKGYLLLASPHESGKALIAKVTPTRVVCANTMAVALGTAGARGEYRMPHYQTFDPKAAIEAIGLARETLVAYEANCKKLWGLQLDREKMLQVLGPIFADVEKDDLPGWASAGAANDDELTPRVKRILELVDTQPGGDVTGKTAWGLVNAVTFYADHESGKSPDGRMASAWLGTMAARKQRTFDSLLQLAA
jgi:phage/plasmid-like protein (TIGR03299 family)